MSGMSRGRKLPVRASAAGTTVKPKGKGKTGWIAAATAVSKAAKSQSKAATGDESGQSMDSDTQAYKQIGDAGESIANTYKANKKAASSS